MQTGVNMTDSIEFWHAEHRSFSRLLDVFEKQLSAFHTGERPDYDLMLDIISYLRYFPDQFHHPREDVAFARLVVHDPALQPVINRLLQEHRVIAAAGEELLTLLSEAVQGSVMPREKVEAAAATYLVYYRYHISKEETQIMPRAAQLLTASDWTAVARATAPGPDPLFGAQSADRYRELRRQIALEAGEVR